MKFGDKLSQLRKEKGLSQEELATKLNVTIQTISEWELGQSKPDTNKLTEISNLLNVDINQLIDNETSTKDNLPNTSINYSDPQPRKWLLIVLIIIAIIIVIILASKFVTDKKNKAENTWNIFDIFENIYNNQDNNQSNIEDIFNDAVNDQKKESFNSTFELYTGTKYGSQVSMLLDNIITNNKTNSTHILTVIYNELNTTDESEIRNLKKQLDDWTEYEVILDYDENGYINKITIEAYSNVSDFDISSFNNKFESYAGTSNGISVSSLIDKIITNNKTNEEHIINVVYGSINTTNESEIRNIKKKLDDWTNYEVILDYDEVGFINKVTIEK